MRIFPFKDSKYGMGIPITALMVAAAFLLALPCPAASETASDSDTPVDPIRITADKLVIDNQAHSADFRGQVKAVQGTTEVTADRLILYYRGSKNTAAESRADNIEKINAQGHVRIVFDNRVAVSEQAVYTTNDRKLILTGPGSQITSDQNVISGKEIIFDRNNGRVEVNNKGKGQVKAIIQSDQRGLN